MFVICNVCMLFVWYGLVLTNYYCTCNYLSLFVYNPSFSLLGDLRTAIGT